MNKSTPWPGHILTLIAGAIYPLGFSPFNWWLITLLSLTLLIPLLRQPTAKATALRGWLFGLGMYGTGVSWVYVSINQFGNAHPILAGFLTLLFVAFIAALFAIPQALLYRFLSRNFVANAVVTGLAFTASWLLVEWTKTWLLTGFPWLLAGYSLTDTLVRGLAPIFGVLSLSLALLSGAWLIWQLWFTASEKLKASQQVSWSLNLTPLILTMGLWGSGWLAQNTNWTSPKSQPPLQVAAVQANIPQTLKWNPNYVKTTIERYLTLSEKHWNVDLLVWSENAIPVLYPRAQRLLESLTRQTKETNTTLITGIPFIENTPTNHRYFNGILAISDQETRYHKQKLVPFGEYVPLESWLRGLISFFDLPMSSFSKGKDSQPPLQGINNTTIAPFICYEVVYPDFVAKNATTDVLITISNDTWFGDSIGPHQHFQMARMRALETQRYLIRATNDGITAIINPAGKTVKQLPQFDQGVLTGEVKAMAGKTPFMQWQSWPIIILTLVMMAGLLAFRQITLHEVYTKQKVNHAS
ncbi:apolipoprotein N-acyltransferase [Endozoicomonas sp. SM1973]|uniref:Apolipoprotein N-acyltransferase n=1 Tax=Spartinivicinus marinus TaxID=2994442 RepID=A0A853I853_9GAMM|nr:apolipoprotein N-acyltransferase [Spartinivicinus marinus]MCX4026002.1 apolipoprotein N-acyltransferase [Spartinivicinus marinus]NYZ67902.1 apolipoprotein N-acyltransferase [Spartinivicinus marinus]